MASSLQALSLFLVMVGASWSHVFFKASNQDHGNKGLKRIHLYIHETVAGPNATMVPMLVSPLGANSSFGSMDVFNNELRVGPDRASQLVGRFQLFSVGTAMQPGSGYLTSVAVVFTAGEYTGSTLTIEGHVRSFTDPFERAVVGGTGKFRLARGYSHVKFVGKATPETDVYEIDIFVLIHRGKYYNDGPMVI